MTAFLFHLFSRINTKFVVTAKFEFARHHTAMMLWPSSLSLLCSLLVFLPASSALSYWIHPSCTEALLIPPGGAQTNPMLTPRWTGLLNEVKGMAQNGYYRLLNPTDYEYARFFNTMFNVNPGAPSRVNTLVDPGARIKG